MIASTLLVGLTFVVTGLVVLVLVVYLIGIIIALRRAGTHLEGLAGGLQQIADDTTPLSGHVSTINNALTTLRDGLNSVDQHLVGIARVLKL